LENIYIDIIRKINQSKEKTFKIDNLGIEFKVDDELSTALLLTSLPDVKINEKANFISDTLNLDKVLYARDLIKVIEEKRIRYVSLIGKKIEIAYKMFLKKYSKYVYEDGLVKTLNFKNHILIPLQLDDDFTNTELKHLSTIGVNVIVYDVFGYLLYVMGKKVVRDDFDDVALLIFISSIGFHVTEYYMGLLLFQISKVSIKIEKLILNNIESTFVKSLYNFDYSLVFHLRYDSLSEDNKYFQELINILKTIPFEKIKDMHYSFVKSYICDKEHD